MNSTIFKKGIPLIAVLLFLNISLVLGADGKLKNSRGKVETVDVMKRVFVLNESEYSWNRDTLFTDEKGAPVKIERLKRRASVLVQWEPVKGSWKRIAKKVCIFSEEG